MARGAEERTSPKKHIALTAAKAAALLMLAAAPYFIFCGLPPLGLPDAEDVARIEITRFPTNETKSFDGAEEIKLAREAAAHLRLLPFAKPDEEEPRCTLAFVTRAGKHITLTAGLRAVEYKGSRSRAPRELCEHFVKTIEEIFSD